MPDEVKSRVGLVSANDGVYPWLSVREMLLFFADLYGLPPREAQDNLRELADLFEFDVAARPPLLALEHRSAAARDVGPGADPYAAGDAAG